MVGLGSCASLVERVPLSELLEPLDMALENSPETLVIQARTGDGKAQLAMAIVTKHGLNGSAKDVRGAADWMAQAVANRRTTPITQYTSAFNGQPSRVNLIYVPVPALPPAQFEAVERCLIELERGMSLTSNCGDDVTARNDRRQAWVIARR